MYVAAYYARTYDIKAHIISEYGMDFAEYINDFALMAAAPSGGRTLIYKNNVENGRRTQFCPNPEDSTPVPLDDATATLIADADILIVAPSIPNYSDVYTSEAVGHAGQNCKKILMPQGLLREINDALVSRGGLRNPNISSLFDVMIMSDEDVYDALETAESWSESYRDTAIIVTRSKHGAVLLKSGNATDVPTERSLSDREIVNSIGAGDMFSAEVAMKLFEGTPAELSIRLTHTSVAKALTSRDELGLRSVGVQSSSTSVMA